MRSTNLKTMANFVHIPVMKEECLEGLNLKDGGIYFDGTLGGAGHSYEILKRASPNGKLIATDLDDYAISRAKERLNEFDGRFFIHKSNFKNFREVLDSEGVEKVDGILLDLGVSSFQLDDKSRGFSYLANEQPLDMRMDNTQKLTACDIVNTYSEHQLKSIIAEYGEEKFAFNVAKNIVERRKTKQIETIGELNKIIEESIPRKFQVNGHPSKKTFQALRIEVNGELNSLYETVIEMTRSLKKGGRIVILTFHSLEDRIVKRAFKELEIDCVCDKSLPICVCGKKKEVEIITKHPIVSTEREIQENSRCKSAKLRIAEKI